MNQVAKRRASVAVVEGKALADESASVHRLNVVLAEPFGPVGTHADETRHEQARNEPEGNHCCFFVVDVQPQFVERPVFEHLGIRCAFHSPFQKNGVFESASWDLWRSSVAHVRHARQPTHTQLNTSNV